MTKKFKTVLKAALLRTGAILLLLVIIGAALVGCSGKTSKKELESGVNTTAENQLDNAQLKALAEFILNSTEKKTAGDGKDYTLREMFTAAYRGIDMTAEGFNDAACEPKYLTEAETGASEETTAASAAPTFASDAEAGKKILGMFNAVDVTPAYQNINAADMYSIVMALQTSPEIGKVSGFFNYILYYIGVALNWITNLFGGSYVLGLLIFSIAIEILLIAFSIKQQKNSIKQAMLGPKEAAVRKKYEGRTDNVTKQKMNEEIQAMYQRENYSPLSGCLPILLQLPIIFALYYIVIDPLQYMLGQNAAVTSTLSTFYQTARAAGGFGGGALASSRGTIEILSRIKEAGVDAFSGIKEFVFFGGETGAKAFEALTEIGDKIPNFTIGSVNLGFTPSFGDLSPINVQAWLLLVPILTFVSYFFSMKLTKKFSYQSPMAQEQAAGCSGKVMDLMMPLMSVFISFSVPAAVGVYWVFKSLVGVLKQFILSKAMPLPKFTKEDYKAAEREYLGKSPKKSGGNGGKNSGSKPRSLHYIDDDEYDYVAPVKKKSNGAYVEDDDPIDNNAPKPEEKKNSMLSGADIKDYDDREDK